MRLVRGAKPLCKEPELGDPVIFYTHAVRDDRVSAGTIVEVTGDAVAIRYQSVNGTYTQESVRHVDDEGLILHPTWKEFGAWDYAAWFKRVMRLEAIVDAVQEKYDNKQPTPRAKKTAEKLAQAADGVDETIDAEEPELAAAE
jgi:hypothetical protein